MDQATVVQVLRRVEWVLGYDRDFCPWCYQGRSQGHSQGCKLAALLSKGEKEKVVKAPVIKIWTLGPLEGLRAWLVGKAFNLAAWLAGYDVELVIDPGSEKPGVWRREDM